MYKKIVMFLPITRYLIFDINVSFTFNKMVLLPANFCQFHYFSRRNVITLKKPFANPKKKYNKRLESLSFPIFNPY